MNQIIVGIAGEEKAQACIWSGGKYSNGWKSARFSLDAPKMPGVYYIRVRYAQDYSCENALDWWKIDRPYGPTLESNIGFIHIQGD